MDLHTVLQTLKAPHDYDGHATLQWGGLVRAVKGKAHLYPIPTVNGIVPNTVWFRTFGYDVPEAWCGAKARQPKEVIYIETGRGWGNFCDACQAKAVVDGIAQNPYIWFQLRQEVWDDFERQANAR